MCVLIVAFAAFAAGPDRKADEPKKQEQPRGDGHAVQFKPGVAVSPHAPRFSPTGTQVKLTPIDLPKLAGQDHLSGRIPLGPPEVRGNGQLVVIARSEAGKPYDLLFVDSNLDGSLADEKPISTKPNVLRDKWWSAFQATLKVNHAARGAEPRTVDYPVSFWTVVEKPDQKPDLIRYTRGGYMIGSIRIGEAEYNVAVSDGNNDGVLGAGDYWAIQRVNGDEPLGRHVWRRMPDFSWAGGKAWKLEMVGTNGSAGRLFSFDPGVSQVDDESKRDLYKADREAARAAKPVPFEKDFEEALKKAGAAKQPCYVKFETDWCGPCKIMAALVFTARDVAEAADGIVCVTVDGDQRKDLTQKYKVGGYPTGVMLDATGKEIGRTIGYQGVKATSEFFRKHKARP
jgi:thiol-disulfide isomerase/thioredoxin